MNFIRIKTTLAAKFLFCLIICSLFLPINRKRNGILSAQEPMLFQENSSPIKKQIFQCQFYLNGPYVVLETIIQPGYAILKDKDASFINFYTYYKNNNKKLITKENFKGKTASSNPLYLASVEPVKIKKGRFGQAKKIIADMLISYCDLSKGICYQEKKTLSIESDK